MTTESRLKDLEAAARNALSLLERIQAKYDGMDAIPWPEIVDLSDALMDDEVTK